MKQALYGLITGIIFVSIILGINYFANTKYNKGYCYGYNDGINYALDSIPPKIDTCYIMSTPQIDSLQERLFVAEYKLGRIKAYKEIVDRNPSQIKFLKGWINRVLE